MQDNPALYLDPLLPLVVRADPRSIPDVAGAVPSRALVVSGGRPFRISPPVTTASPGITWLPCGYHTIHAGAAGVTSATAGGTTAPAGAADEATARGTSATGVAATARPAAGGLWLLVIGQRLLDQLVVGAFGEPGFGRFLEGFAGTGRSPVAAIPKEVPGLLAALAGEIDARPPAFRVRARAILTDVMLALYRATLLASEDAVRDGFGLASILDHIELNYDHELDLESLAKLAGTSPTHFSRLFRRDVGVPLFEYINRTRIRKACVLLRRTDVPVTRIALDVGYNNVSFFNRYFRRIMLTSPRDYRRSVTE